jgi:energy-coupling factor transporter ATP-binding protein EcfA2
MDKSDENAKKPSPSDELITIANSEYEVIFTKDGEFIAYALEGPKVAIPIFGTAATLSDRLMRRYRDLFGKTPNKRFCEEAIRVLLSDASLTPQIQTHVRHAKHESDIYIDLGDETGEAIQLSGGDWQIVNRPPVYFQRSALTAPLVRPVRGGEVSKMFEILNIQEEVQSLLICYLAASQDPTIPIPLIVLNGEQGSGKSTFSKLLRELIDPSPVPLQSPPTNENSWIEIAGNCRLIALDNLSNLDAWLSDVLCRAVTGGGRSKRKHYSNKEQVIYDFKRVIILNGISVAITRDDLVDRILPLELPVISSSERKFESDIYKYWASELPEIFGALLTLSARIHNQIPHVEMKEIPRMADFARALKAMDDLEGTNALGVYLREIGAMASSAVELDSFLQAIVKEIKSTWKGSAAELLSRIDSSRPYREDADWPITPRNVTERLSRTAPVLRKLGWKVDDLGSRNQAGIKQWMITPPS